MIGHEGRLAIMIFALRLLHLRKEAPIDERRGHKHKGGYEII